MTGSTCGQSWPICLSKKEKSSKGKSTHVGHLLTPFFPVLQQSTIQYTFSFGYVCCVPLVSIFKPRCSTAVGECRPTLFSVPATVQAQGVSIQCGTLFKKNSKLLGTKYTVASFFQSFYCLQASYVDTFEGKKANSQNRRLLGLKCSNATLKQFMPLMAKVRCAGLGFMAAVRSDVVRRHVNQFLAI